MAYSKRFPHFGTLVNTGHIISAYENRLIDHGPSPSKLTPEVLKVKIHQTVGDPFILLPGNPPAHRVVGELKDGTPIKAGIVMMAYNDAITIDEVHGEGAYQAVCGPDLLEVLELAKKLYVQ